ncbi:MAG: hypothetical protein VW907_05535 [Opitutae bacterium]
MVWKEVESNEFIIKEISLARYVHPESSKIYDCGMGTKAASNLGQSALSSLDLILSFLFGQQTSPCLQEKVKY